MNDISTPRTYRCDLNHGTCIVNLKAPLMHQDSLADVFRVAVCRANVPVGLAGMGVTGYLYYASTRQTLLLQGTTDGHYASVALSSPCYATPGYASLVIQLQDGDVRHTLLKANFCIDRTGTESVLDPDDVLPSLPDLLGQIETLRAVTAQGKEVIAGIQADTDAAIARTDAAAASADAAAQAAEAAGQEAVRIAREASQPAIAASQDAAQSAEAAARSAQEAAAALSAVQETVTQETAQAVEAIDAREAEAVEAVAARETAAASALDAQKAASVQAVQAAAQTAAAYQEERIAVKGEQTLASIPDDYTKLGQDVAALTEETDNLKSTFVASNGIEIGALISGKYINRNNGTEGDDSNSLVSDYIPVIPGLYVWVTGLYMEGVRGLALYKSDYTYLTKPSPQADTMEFLVPVNAAYMRVTTHKNTAILTACYSNIHGLIRDINDNKLGTNLGSANRGKLLSINDDGDITTSEPFKGPVYDSNPIDANAITANGWYSASVNGKQYFTNIPADTSGVITLYTSIKVGGGSAQANQFCVDQKMDVWGRLLNTSTQTAITDWQKLTGSSTPTIGLQKSRWYGKTIKCFGDSRTWYDGHAYNDKTKTEWAGRTCAGYQQTIAELTGATVVSDGHSGATSPTICEYIRNADLTGVDAVLLEGGVNDFVKASSVTTGEIAPIGSEFDTTTVYGAWQSAVEYIMTNYPQVSVYMTIPAIAWTIEGLFPYDIAKIKGEVAKLYNLPCIDLYKDGGINDVNRDYFYVDDVDATNWRLHFNDYGNKWIGEKLAKFVDNK